jgi:cell division septal protein FtsQ
VSLALARLLVFLLLAGLIAALVYFSSAEQFFVYSAEISGQQRIGEETIYTTSGVHAQNIFWIRPQRVAEQIARLDGIKAVRVRCGLPARVRIEVTERVPILLWRAERQGRDWWLDEEGVVLPYHGELTDTVFVIDKTDQNLRVGDRVEPEGIARSVRQLAGALPDIEVFYYLPDEGLSFRYAGSQGSWPVYIGSTEDLAKKLQVLQALTEYLAQERILPQYVDVRWPDYPVYGELGSKAEREQD